MGGLFLCRTGESDSASAALLSDAERQFAAHGFAEAQLFSIPGYRGFHCDFIQGGPSGFYRSGNDFIAIAGTFHWKGQCGAKALAAALAAITFPFTQWDEAGGQFVALVHKGGRSLIFTDYFAAFQLFIGQDARLFSTSFLATCASAERLHLEAQSVYEYAFNIFPTGDDSFFSAITRLGPYVQIELGSTHNQRHAVAKPLPAHLDSDTPLAERLEQHHAALRAAVQPYAATWGDKIQCPLSGGLDSRLALSLLRDAAVHPHVYVYGSSADEDVVIARAIADGEGFALEAFDKDRFAAPDPDAYAEIVRRNFHECDALVTDGGLFDNGGNRFARHARQRDGQLAVSGGCGEVFRNFFYLPDKNLHAKDVMRAFYARFFRQDTTARFSPRHFLDRLTHKAQEALQCSAGSGKLSRVAVEQLYPRMRCRAFFGREISLVGRHGGYLMPFYDHHVVAHALQLPLALKNLGRFEAALCAHIDPKLAAYPSAYGHSFMESPTRRQIWSEALGRMRPAWLRQHSYALRRHIGHLDNDGQSGILSPVYLGRVIDLHFPVMRHFFRIESIRDAGLYRRIAAMELLCQYFSDRLEIH